MTSSTLYRRGIWVMKGKREYTKAGFEAASQKFQEKDVEVDCSDRHFLITGANSGLGLATALEIAKRGGILHLVCRNAKAMKEARSQIITTTGNDRIYQHQVNLAKPSEVATWAKDFTETHGRLDVLIHNAGVLVHEREVDEDNIETMFAINVLAVHLLTLILLPVLRRSNDPRVIIVSSAGMLTVRLDGTDLNFENMNPFDGRLAYSQTKRQQVVMNFAYAQRYDKVRFYSMHPGWADTPGVQKSLPEFYEQMKDRLRTPLQGADTVVWLAISEAALTHSSGLFFQDRLPVTTHLPLAWTRTSNSEEQQFMKILDNMFVQYSSMDPSPVPKPSGHPDRVEMNGEQENLLHRPSESEQNTSEAEIVEEAQGTAETLDVTEENAVPEIVLDHSEQNYVETNHTPDKIFDDNGNQSLHNVESEFTESGELERDSNKMVNDVDFEKRPVSNDSNLDHTEHLQNSLEEATSNDVSHSDIVVNSSIDNIAMKTKHDNVDPSVEQTTEVVLVAEEAIDMNSSTK